MASNASSESGNGKFSGSKSDQVGAEPGGAFTGEPRDVLVVGAGFSGIGAGIKLKEAGLDFLILEKADQVGGVWRDNTYPDCACDVPAALYSYSFSPNPDWSQVFANQEEILAYLRGTATKYGVLDQVVCNREMLDAAWDEDAACWEVTTNAGAFRARFLIVACGPMHVPVVPKIRGLESFPGASFHSARWDHTQDLGGKRVAVVGSGASAIQLVPAIQPAVKELALFQRTPHWVLPKFDRKISPQTRQRFRNFPLLQAAVRALFYTQFELLNGSFRFPRVMKRLQRLALTNIYRTVKDPELRKRVTPNYVIGCKRILQSNRWYRALVQPNVQVLGGLAEVQGRTLIGSDGSRVDADVVVFATGFEIANPPIARRITGASGKALADLWQGSPRGFHGTMVEDCPNCFLMFGPNLAITSSAFIIIEAQIRYIVDALRKARAEKIRVIRVDEAKMVAYNIKVQASLEATVWNNGGCSSYFLDEHGRNSTGWPWSTFYMRNRLGRFRLRDYQVEKN